MSKPKTMKILVAEDDKFLSKIYNEKLKGLGFEIALAADGEEALTMIKSEKPDIILLDLIMPKKNGFDVLEEIKKDEKLKKIPVLIASNLGQESDVEKAMKLGAVDYLIKSDSSFDEILEKIQKYAKK